MQVRIYREPKNAMQSGYAKSRRWVMEFEPEVPREVEPLMGWTSSRDTRSQIRLFFASKDEAVSYARRKGLLYHLEEAKDRIPQPKSYADNFSSTRLGRWTH